MKANFAYYKSKVNKYFSSDEKEEVPTKGAILEKLNGFTKIEQLDLYIKNVKDDMIQSNLFDPSRKIAELKEGLGELAT